MRRLDGLPLAIELAAAQLRTRSLLELTTQLETRYDSQLALADRRTRTLPDRHHTMRAAIDWSYQLLAPEEQALFRAMSVFAGGATFAAIEQFAGPDEVDELLARLVDQSVLVAEVRPEGTRYRMLELVRAYATERLVEAGDARRVRELHAVWCVALATSAAHYGGIDHTERVAQLAAGGAEPARGPGMVPRRRRRTESRAGDRQPVVVVLVGTRADGRRTGLVAARVGRRRPGAIAVARLGVARGGRVDPQQR